MRCWPRSKHFADGSFTNISKAVYYGWKFNRETDDEDDLRLVQALMICERFGWALEYVLALPVDKFFSVLGYMDGINKVDAERHQR